MNSIEKEKDGGGKSEREKNGREKNACGNGQIGTVLVINANAWPLERAHCT